MGGVRTIGVGHHMSQFIFTDVWVFWGYFRGKMHYMSMLQRWAFSGKLGFWEILEGPRGDPRKKNRQMEKIFFSQKSKIWNPKGILVAARSAPLPPERRFVGPREGFQKCPQSRF